ncbi:MAG: tetratricopeptide repeat protein, partial [Microcoleaceae cyanobacterium]
LPAESLPDQHKTDLANHYFNLAYQQSEAGNTAGAISQYQRAIAEKPDYGQAYYNLGTLYQQQGNIDLALQYCDIAIQLLPKELGAICAFSLADILVKNQRELQAIKYYRQAICLNPQLDNACYSLGKTYKQLDLLENSIICYQQLIAKQPDYAEAYVMLGNVNKLLGLQQRAIAYFERAIELKPDLAETHNNLSLSLLLVGNYAKGWQEYEWRWQTPQGRKLANFALWQGEALNGANILIQTEQGLGDSLQFIRYIPFVVARGGRVILECQKPLKRLFSNFPGVAEIYGQGENLPPVKVQIPLLSLPGILQTRLDNIPADIPYLYPPTDIQITLPKVPLPAYKIGIVWASNPQNATSRYRCCHLNYFRELTNIAGIQLYSLQKDQAVNDLQADDLIINLDHLIHDFADTAAIIAQLDLVITVDTAVAHLAGAMGKQVWVLLPFNPDWRWLDPDSLNQSENTINIMNYQEYSPWYPTMRLFRQPRRHDWSKVFQNIKLALGEVLATADNIKTAAKVKADETEKNNLPVNSELTEILNQAYNLRQASQAPEAIALLESTLEKVQQT